jgi:signal transduction histidine kinase
VLRFESIISRVVWLHVVAVCLTAVFIPLAHYWLLRSTADDLLHRSLRENADMIAGHLALGPDDRWLLKLPDSLQVLYSEAYGRWGYAVVDDAGRLLFSSSGDRSAIFPEIRAASPRFLEVTRGAEDLYGASVPEEVAGRMVWVQVTQDLAHRDVLVDDVVSGFFVRVGWITPPILLVLLLIDIVVIRRALRPVYQVSENAKKIGPMRTDIRLAPDSMPDEIRPLVLAINQALDRIDQGFRAQREFTADAAHELRTPLAILRARVDTFVDRAATYDLRRDIAGMSRIVEQLLDIAEMEAFVLNPGDRADLKSVCAEVIEVVAPLALAHGKAIELKGGEQGPIWGRGRP